GFEFAQKQYEQEKLLNQVYIAINDFTGETYNFVESKEELVENTTQEDKENKKIDIEKLDENNNKEANKNKEPEDLSKYNYIYHETFGENSENELYYESDNRSWKYDFDDEWDWNENKFKSVTQLNQVSSLSFFLKDDLQKKRAQRFNFLGFLCKIDLVNDINEAKNERKKIRNKNDIDDYQKGFLLNK
ncbi:23717_t:CDS:2, partial [Dentiscutata erythropus]